jgi:hypothetical protein
MSLPPPGMPLRDMLARKFCTELCGQEICTDEGNWLVPQTADTINDWMLELADMAIEHLRLPAAEEKPRVPKVRTSHHRNKEEAARLQSLVDERYAPSPSPAAGITPEMRAAIQRGCDEVNANISAAGVSPDVISRFKEGLMIASDRAAILTALRFPAAEAPVCQACKRSLAVSDITGTAGLCCECVSDGFPLRSPSPAGSSVEVLRKENGILRDMLLNPNPDDEPDNIRLHREKCDALEKLLAAQRENHDLRAALSWMEDQDPQMVEAARERFSLSSTTRDGAAR